MTGRLTELQTRVLALLADVTPPWTLTGGAALAGFHLGHRTTRDLDLFWHGQRELGRAVEACCDRFVGAQLDVAILQRSPSFARLQVRDARESLVVDLVAEPVAFVEAPALVRVGEATIRIDTVHEILVNKLGALLQRSELRDLVDIEQLLARGGNLERALEGAARKDGGFSPLALGWTLANFDVLRQAAASSWDAPAAAALEAFRADLARRIGERARP